VAAGWRAAVLVALATLPAGARPAADALRRCDEAFARAPGEYDSSFCYYQAAQQPDLAVPARQRLETLLAHQPDNFWLVLTRGHLELHARDDSAERFYRRAAQGFAAQGHAAGEIAARYNLRALYHRKGRFDEAGAQVARVTQLAEASGDPALHAQAATLEAAHLVETNSDLGRADRALRRAESATFPGGPYRLRRLVLLGLANVSFGMGRLDEALLAYRRLVELTRAEGDTLNHAIAWYGLANTRLRQLEERPEAGGADEVRAAAEAALQAARASGNRDIETSALRTLGEAAAASGRRAEARAALEQCLAVARRLGQARETSGCLWALGTHLAEDHPRRGDALVDESIRVALARDDHTAAALAWRARMRLSWRTRAPGLAFDDSLAALRAIETLRDRQPEGGSAARLFAAWASDYHWPAGRLLLEHERGDAAALPRAFALVERLRARTLLDALDAAAAGQAPATPEAQARAREARARIVAWQQRLLDPAGDPASRPALLAQLQRAEDDEAEARRALRPAPLRGRPAGFATLDEVRAQLAPDEALLSFQTAPWTDVYGAFGGGAWLVSVTRDGARAWRLPDRARIESSVGLFLGLIERRDGSEAEAAARLHATLLRPALDALPAGVRRLVIVPDGALHRLPWAALRDAAGRPLPARYETSIAPSASLWLRARRAGVPRLPPAVLALADPTRAGASGRDDAQRSWPLVSGVSPGRLPHARREGRAALRLLGGDSRLLAGRAASEHELRRGDLAAYGVLHFAAHALVDDERPERSAVLLAPGADDEDGLLQWREIAELPLARRMVVLSACRSAGGTLLQGEGVLGLARAFFEAGASSVIGGLWPLRDDETADLFARFYRHLRAGARSAEALRAAQDEAAREGQPAAAWAGVVLLGDGQARLDERATIAPWATLALAGAGLALVARAITLARRSDPSQRSAFRG
jgi:CHAT domain-containing protein/tetratricopeptide (TPR) repeat protein